MKARLARKILTTTYSFKEFRSNYQPYSIPQQRRAIKVVGRRYSKEARDSLYTNGVIRKIPKELRKSKGFLPREFNI